MYFHKCILVFVILVFNTKIYSAYGQDWELFYDHLHIKSVENTKIGLLAGEFDQRIQLNPYNGLLLSNDLGGTWTEFGLKNTGVTDISFFDGTILASTYYSVDGLKGLYSSDDEGKTWSHIGPNASATTVAQKENVVALGTYSNGLWISQDEGSTFSQALGYGWFGPKIMAVEIDGKNIIASTQGTTYISIDAGTTWTEVPSLTNFTVGSLHLTPKIYIAGTIDSKGVWISLDQGKTWQKSASLGDISTTKVFEHAGVLFVGTRNPATTTPLMYTSDDLGITWEHGNAGITAPGGYLNDMTVIIGYPDILIGAIELSGLYKLETNNSDAELYQFLDIPWKNAKSYELTDRITAYFDHAYPLLGYGLKNEPEINKNLTLNYLGDEAEEPRLYYSSHSGTDFALAYGTVVTAPADGIAYYYYCNTCGHTIKLDHNNGYQTVYQHLQEEGLKTKADPTPVAAGETLGKIGLTGRTSGPHLHFEVIYDSNGNNSFSDEFPHGRTDPFGWQRKGLPDPWENYAWTDSLGEHEGQKSKYLWKHIDPRLELTHAPKITSTSEEQQIHSILNKTVILPSDFLEIPFSLYLRPIPRPSNPPDNLYYIPNTSIRLEIFDTTGKTITSSLKPLILHIDLEREHFEKFDFASLKVHYFDEYSHVWIPLESAFDSPTGRITASISHFSDFAVFGSKNDTSPPRTAFIIEGIINDGWYSSDVTLSLYSEAPDLNTILVSSDQGHIWDTYTTPIVMTKSGIYTFLIKSIDINENIEQPTEIIIKLDKGDLSKDRVRIYDATFNL